MLVVITVWCAVLIVVTIAYLLVCTDRRNTGVRGNLKELVFKTIPAKFGNSLLLRPVQSCINKVFFERNHYI